MSLLLPKRRDIPDGRKYLDSLRELPCVVTGRVGNVEPAHLRLTARRMSR